MIINVYTVDPLRDIEKFNQLGFMKIKNTTEKYGDAIGTANVSTVEELIQILDAIHQSEGLVYPELIIGKNTTCNEINLEIYNGWRE